MVERIQIAPARRDRHAEQTACARAAAHAADFRLVAFAARCRGLLRGDLLGLRRRTRCFRTRRSVPASSASLRCRAPWRGSGRCANAPMPAMSSGVPVGEDRAAAMAAFGAQVDHPVGGLDHVEVVLDHHDRVAVVAQLVQHGEQVLDVVEVQAGGRLVEDVQRAAGIAAREFLRQLHALRFAAGQRGRRLAELDVAQADVDQRLELARDRRHRLEQLQRVLDRHLQHVVDAVALVEDLQRLAVVALAVADVAGHVHVGQEVHLDLDQAVALAGFAAAAAHVEAEAARRVAARARFRHLREQLAQRREQAGVGRRIANAACGRSATGRCRRPCRTARCPALRDAARACARRR